MLPVLLDLRFIKIYTFGVFLVLAFFWSAFLLWRNIRLTSFKEDEIFDGIFITISGGLIAGRILYIVLNFRDFGFDILKMILVNGYPGFSFYGFLLGGVLSMYFFLTLKKIKFIDAVDYFVSPSLLALGIAKIGSFFAGVEIGAKTKLPLAVKYAGFDGFRHLTALYEGILFLLGAFVTYKLLFEIRRQRYGKGFTFYFFFWYVALVYFLLDGWKAQHLTLFTNDSLNRTISLAILLTFSFYFLYYFRDLIIKRILSIKNLTMKYGQKTISSIHKTARKKT